LSVKNTVAKKHVVAHNFLNVNCSFTKVFRDFCALCKGFSLAFSLLAFKFPIKFLLKEQTLYSLHEYHQQKNIGSVL